MTFEKKNEIINGNVASMVDFFDNSHYNVDYTEGALDTIAEAGFDCKQELWEQLKIALPDGEVDEIKQRIKVKVSYEKEIDYFLADCLLRDSIECYLRELQREDKLTREKRQLYEAVLSSVTSKIFRENVVTDDGETILHFIGFDKARQGQKLSRLLNKYEGIDKVKLERWANEIKGGTKTLDMYVSVSAYDFARMSYGNSWNSCHAPSGCYSAGPYSYITDMTSFITYIEASGGKKLATRIHGILSKETLTLSRVYGDDSAYNGFKALVETMANNLSVHHKLEHEIGYYKIRSTREGSGSSAYPDWSSNAVRTAIFEDDIFPYRRIGNEPICVTCGDSHTNDHIECGDCLVTCSDCEDSCHERDLTPVYGGNAVCSYCLENNYSWSDRDEVYYHENECIFVNDIDSYVHEDDATWCSECEQYVLDDDYNWEHDCCVTCLEDNYTMCQDCGEYVVNGDILTNENGDHVCPDCYEVPEVSDIEERTREFNASRF